MTREPTRRIAPVAQDVSPAYGDGRGNEVGNAFAELIEQDAAREDRFRATTQPLDAEARHALRAGDLERAAGLFESCAAIYRAGGFTCSADSYARFAAEARTPPKTIGRRGKRGAK